MKDIVYKEVYTRKIDREYNDIIMKDCNTTTDQKGDMKININPINMQVAKDFLVCAMTNLTQTEVDELSIVEYDKINEKIEKIKTPSKK